MLVHSRQVLCLWGSSYITFCCPGFSWIYLKKMWWSDIEPPLLSVLLATLELSSELVGRLQVRDQLRTKQDAMLLEIQDLTSLWSQTGPYNDVYILFFFFCFFKASRGQTTVFRWSGNFLLHCELGRMGFLFKFVRWNQNRVLGGDKGHDGGVMPGFVLRYQYILFVYCFQPHLDESMFASIHRGSSWKRKLI